jgi:hypothetical protein
MGEELRDRVRERYAEVARSVRSGSGALDSKAPEVDWAGGSYTGAEKRELPQARSRLLWDAATRWRWRPFLLARSCSI